MVGEFERHCPQCGEAAEALVDGYCPECAAGNQRRLDLHNAEFDRWERLSDEEREAEIRNRTGLGG